MNPQLRGQLSAELDRHWVRLVLIIWALTVVYYVWSDWGYVRWLSLGDTDDNMRLMQVRGLLNKRKAVKEAMTHG